MQAVNYYISVKIINKKENNINELMHTYSLAFHATEWYFPLLLCWSFLSWYLALSSLSIGVCNSFHILVDLNNITSPKKYETTRNNHNLLIYFFLNMSIWWFCNLYSNNLSGFCNYQLALVVHANSHGHSFWYRRLKYDLLQ